MGFSSRNGRRVLTSVLAEARGPGTPEAFVTIVVCNEGRLFPDTMENAGPFIGHRIGGQAIVLAGVVCLCQLIVLFVTQCNMSQTPSSILRLCIINAGVL